MGFFSNTVGKIFGFGNDEGRNAANIIAAANAEARKGITEQFGATSENIAPFITAGREALPGVVQGSTAEGLSERLNEIFGSDIFQGLLREQTEATQGQLSAAGLTRSGTALEEINKLPLEIGLMIENLLAERQQGLAGSGVNAAFNLGSFGERQARDVAGITQATGGAQAQGGLLDAAASLKGTTNLLKGASALGQGTFGGGGGFSLGKLASGFASSLSFGG